MATGPRLSSPYSNNVTERGQSRYTQGGLSDRYQKRIGWWDRYNIKKDDSDFRYTVTPRTVGRPDLIAHDVYQNSALGWLILQYNNIVDINTELTVGKLLFMPSPRRMSLDIMSKPTGGNRV